MVNEEKLRIMTKLAVYEKEPLRTEIEEAGHYRWDYICTHLLTVVWRYSAAYLLVLMLLALYHFEYFLSTVRLPEIRTLFFAALAVYLLLLAGCAFFTVVLYSSRYHTGQKKRREYLAELKKMEMFYTQGREGGNE